LLEKSLGQPRMPAGRSAHTSLPPTEGSWIDANASARERGHPIPSARSGAAAARDPGL